MAYANVKNLESRWRPLAPGEEEVAKTLLEDAEALLSASGYAQADETMLEIVSCNMVRRAMTTDGDAFGVDGQTTPSMGWASSLPAGDMWLTRQERNMLRGGARIGSIQMQELCRNV